MCEKKNNANFLVTGFKLNTYENTNTYIQIMYLNVNVSRNKYSGGLHAMIHTERILSYKCEYESQQRYSFNICHFYLSYSLTNSERLSSLTQNEKSECNIAIRLRIDFVHSWQACVSCASVWFVVRA